MGNLNENKGDISGSKIYAGFFIRILAGLLDKLFFWLFILLGFIIMYFFQKMPPKYFWIIVQIIVVLFHFIYNIIIPQFFGGTLGKLLLKLKIFRLDFQKIKFKESFLRYAINFIGWNLYFAIVKIIGIINTPDELYNEFTTFSEWSNYSNIIEPNIINIMTVVMIIWELSEYIILLLNKKKRGLQDYIAGTVIVNTKNYNKVINSTNVA